MADTTAKKAILKAKLDGQITEVLLQLGAANVIVDESAGTTLSSKIAEIVTSLDTKAATSELSALKTLVGTLPNGATATTVVGYIAEAITAADHLKRKKVASTSEISLTAKDADQYIYMVSKTGTDGDSYDEYMVIDGKLEKMGNWAVDLTGYATTSALDALETLVGTLPSGATATTVVGYVDEKIDALNIGSYAKTSDLHSHSNKSVLDGITSDKVTSWDNKSRIFVAGSEPSGMANGDLWFQTIS